MLWFKMRLRWLYILTFCIGLSACGFQPLYKANNQATALNSAKTTAVSAPTDGFSQITIDPIPDRKGQYLRNQLIDTIYIDGYPQNERYRLHVSKPSEHITRLGIQKDATATRAQMRLDAVFTLSDLETGEKLLKRNIIATNSFNILTSQYTTNVSTDYARERALDEIARQVVTQLALYFQRPVTDTVIETPANAVADEVLLDEYYEMLDDEM